MTFQDAVKTCLTQKYVDFSGRARRSEYWWFVLFVFIGNIIFGIIGIDLLGALWSLALLLPGIAVGVRRLHDLDKSGWWLLIALIPLIGLLVLIYFFVQPGTRGANQYGPEPRVEPNGF
ncbi:DUF805 domain-containing protein [Tropicimonas sp. IMCC6043]|uniref:DUF805 domain-containing protein n=1 Tax=Tropicimonas sp. IMCC6043 TaxID=2510645 RepID=UPI00101D93D7|nr:DUF805 domain-containing protein [Tropicimonas sp. IMCC6043]RYH07284.1 DUF805 domain-containing protein [Tropicimonas sp. IMCC6043]